MGFVKVVQPKSHPPCPVPTITRKWKTGEPDFGVGTVWQCDTCQRSYELASIPARSFHGKWKMIANQATEAAPE